MVIDGANSQFRIHLENRSLQRDPVADFPAIFLGQRRRRPWLRRDRAARPPPDPAGTILSEATFRYSSGSVANWAKEFSGRSSMYLPPNQVMGTTATTPGMAANFVAVIRGQQKCQRDAVDA